MTMIDGPRDPDTGRLVSCLCGRCKTCQERIRMRNYRKHKRATDPEWVEAMRATDHAYKRRHGMMK